MAILKVDTISGIGTEGPVFEEISNLQVKLFNTSR